MRELDLLEAEQIGEEAAAPGTSWWRWTLGLAAAAGITYFVIQDIPREDLFGINRAPGPRPW